MNAFSLFAKANCAMPDAMLTRHFQVTIIVAIHQPRPEIWRLYSHAILVKHGRVVCCGPAVDALEVLTRYQGRLANIPLQQHTNTSTVNRYRPRGLSKPYRLYFSFSSYDNPNFFVISSCFKDARWHLCTSCHRGRILPLIKYPRTYGQFLCMPRTLTMGGNC